jgi:hypothetical protein
MCSRRQDFQPRWPRAVQGRQEKYGLHHGGFSAWSPERFVMTATAL